MKQLLLTLIFGLSVFGGDIRIVKEPQKLIRTPKTEGRLEKSKSGYLVAQIVPHLSANDRWKSVLYIRNDSSVTANFFIEFYDPDGDLINAEFLDSDSGPNDPWLYGSSYERDIDGYEIISLEFNVLDYGNSFQAFVFTDDSVFYSVEALFNRYDGDFKQAAVGVQGSIPGLDILMNVEEREDLFTGTANYRAIALTNTEDQPCDCTAYLYDDGWLGANLEGPLLINNYSISMPGRGKDIWVLRDLFDMAVLPYGYGYVWIECTRVISAMGLTFDEGNPGLAGSVPIDMFVYNKKNSEKQIQPRNVDPTVSAREKSPRTR